MQQSVVSDAAQLDQFLKSKISPWERLANSPAIRLYAMQAQSGDDDSTAAREYLENALTLTAEREALITSQTLPRVPVNDDLVLPNPGPGGGLALRAPSGALLFSLGAPDLSPPVKSGVLRGTQTRLFGPYPPADSKAGPPGITLEVPLLAVQSSNQIATLVITYRSLDALIPDAAGSVGPGLSLPILIDPANDIIVQRSASQTSSPAPGKIEAFFSPNFGGSALLRWAATTQGGPARVETADGSARLAAAAPLASSSLIVVRSTPEDEAFADVRKQTWIWLLLSLLALGGSCGLILYAWRRAVHHRAATIHAARDSAHRQLEQANSFLAGLSDTQPSALLVLDQSQTVVFANKAAAALTGADSASLLLGKSLPSIFGPDAARPLERASMMARAQNTRISAATDVLANGRAVNGRVTAMPLDDQTADVSQESEKPGPASGNMLVAFEDFTSIIALRARKEAALKQLVGVLTGLIDARDPDSASQSRRVASLARKVGIALSYSKDMIRDLELAAQLANAGKILVPRSILSKPDALTPEELSQVRGAMAQTGDLLNAVEFEGDVKGILASLDDQHEGSAFEHSAARLIKMINAYVGMTSPRAHRRALSIDDALAKVEQMFADANMVAALSHVVRNLE